MKAGRLFFFLLIFLSQTGKAQYVFTNLRTKDGLSANEVMSIYKDSEGFVWIGTTSGLNRFDGSSFKVFSKRTGNFNNVADETITTIIEYDNGKIFTGNAAGLSFFDKKKGSFTAIPFFNDKNENIKELRVERLITDPLDRLWIFTVKGLFIYKDGKAIPASSALAGNKILDDKYCFTSACQLDTIHHGIWVGTVQGLFFLDYKTNKISDADNNPDGWKIMTRKPVESLSLDKKGNIWISCHEFLIAYFDFAGNTISRIESIPFDDKVWKVNGSAHRVFVDSKDRLWISTWLYKVFVREPDGHFINLPDQSPNLYKLGYGFFHAAMEDTEGNIWIGTLNGLSKLSVQNPLLNLYIIPRASNEDSLAVINSFTEWKDKEWLVLKDNGAYIFNEQTGKSAAITPQTTIHENRFFSSAKIGEQWWIGYGRGIQILDPVSKKLSPFTHYLNNKQVNKSVIWIYEDKKKYVWYGVWGDGIYRYDPRNNETIHYDGSDSQYGDITNVNCLCIMEDHSGLLWFGYGSNGMRVYDHSTGKFSKPKGSGAWNDLDNTVVNILLEDQQNNIWIATNGKGIYKANSDRVCSPMISSENGLSSNNVIAMLMGSHNIIWAATPEGLHFFKSNEKTTSRVDIEMQIPFGETWYLVEKEGKLYASVMNRMAVIDISAADKKKRSLPPIISRVNVFEKEIPFIQADRSIQLKHNQNFFVIEFSSPDHREITSLQYAYKLKGFDRDWVYPGRRQSASYTNVPDGNYTFMVKCTDANGQWIDKETTLTIMIQAPFWKRWWFVSSILLLTAGGIWQLYKMRKNRQREKNIEKTIDYFANSVYGENSVNEICWDIARNCISQLHFEDCVVYLLNDDGTRLIQKAAYGPKNPKGHEIENPLEIEFGKGIVGTVAKTGKPLLIKDTTKDSRYIVDDEKRFSELSVPILHDGKVIGVIDSEHTHKNFFTGNHLKTLTTIASISSNKIAEAQAEENARQHERKLLEINKLLAESQLMALRAQMNPHFVFNCLNSIQECIVTQKYGEASNYLNKFSKLFRTVLNNSGKNLVTLDEEKEVLQLYLELEQMRFEKSFSYNISIEDDLEMDEILIPSMLLQPYVENALWHGLMHKEGERNLNIIFTRINEDVFRCVIDDNGIGRQRSFELKAEQSKTKRHESKGLKISKDRIDVLQKQGYHASLEIIDKPNHGGTTVIIELSTFLKV